MKIRYLLIALLGIFTLLTVGGGVWEVIDAREKLRAVAWIERTNRLADISQRLSAWLAMERGITAATLANPADASASMRDEVLRVRKQVDDAYRALQQVVETLAPLPPRHPLIAGLNRLARQRGELDAIRRQIDAGLDSYSGSVDSERWIDLATRTIEVLADLRSASMVALPDNIYTHSSYPVIKDVLFMLSEYLGRERAIVGVAIARARPLHEAELRDLDQYRNIVTVARQRADAILHQLPMTPALEAALARLSADLLVRHENLRAAVYASSQGGSPYPVTAEQWYREATIGIDAVLHLSDVVGASFERDIGQLRRQADASMILLVVVFVTVLAALVLAMQLIRRRILRPLRILERAAQTISDGDLSRPVPALRDDEFGHLGHAFEHMRRTLLADIRQREQDAGELRKLSKALEQSANAVIITDANGVIEYTNPQFTLTTGYRQSEVKGRKPGIWKSPRTPAEQHRTLWATIRSGRAWEGELVNARKNGELYLAAVSISPVFDEHGEITHFIAIESDISERRRIESQLDFLTCYDPLTRLPNQTLLARRFDEAAAQARRSGTQVALIALGINRFKLINDSLGREVGDELLREIARRLTHCARAHDTVARHVGSEFVVMLTNVDDCAEVREIVAQMMDVALLPLHIRGEHLQPSLNAGISLMPGDGDRLDSLLLAANIALHHSERAGHDLFSFYTSELNAAAQEKLAIENALRSALDNDELELHYQPKLALASGRIVGVEALARWRHRGTGEYVSPERFVPIAEETGLIESLGAWALRTACRQNRAWQRAGLPPIAVAVNLSAAQLRQPELASLIAELLDETGLEARLLELELTESALIENPLMATAALRRLKDVGLRLAIDDFGTGYSSLAYLSRFPVDELKIDRSFVEGVVSDPAAAVISTSIIALAHELGLKVVAEGVESEAQLDFLRRHGCDEMQGYLFSRPLPAGALAELLRSGRGLQGADALQSPRGDDDCGAGQNPAASGDGLVATS